MRTGRRGSPHHIVNLLWIVLDSLRADRCGCFGSRRPTTPSLDRVAAGSFLFDQAISPHIPTHPAHISFLSGTDVFEHQIVAQGSDQEPDPGIQLLPRVLRRAGYRTAAVDNIGRWLQPAFDEYLSYPRWDHDGSRPWRSGEEVTARALPLLQEMKEEQPYFLFLHYWDAHSPYLPPPPFDRMFYRDDERASRHASMEPVWRSAWFANYFREWLDGVRDIEFVKAQYDASVAYLDHCLDPIWQTLTDLDLWDDTLLIVHADHGEELDEHGCWFDHHGLYDTVIRVPLLIRLPGGATCGRSSEMISLLDLMPTALDLLQVDAAGSNLAGQSLRPLLQHLPGYRPRPAYLTECTWMRKYGWRTPEWKLIRALEPDIYGKPPVELYRLPVDRDEQRNLADSRPDLVEQLTAAAEAHAARRQVETGRENPVVAQAGALRTWQPRFIAGRSTL